MQTAAKNVQLSIGFFYNPERQTRVFAKIRQRTGLHCQFIDEFEELDAVSAARNVDGKTDSTAVKAQKLLFTLERFRGGDRHWQLVSG